MKKLRLSISCMLLLLISMNPLSAQLTKEESVIKMKIDNYLSEGVANGFSGSILVAKEGNILLHKGYGMANKEKNIPYSANTVSTIGSVTKQFTATAILKLVDLNKLKLTDPIHTFFKNLPEDKKEITIHQLLTHSSGFLPVIGDGDFDDIPRALFFKTLFATELLHPPGAKYAYSNAAYSILARIIEIVSGQEYESFLNEYLFKPAGMKQTGYFIPQWDEHFIATGYARNVIKVGTLMERFLDSAKVTWTLKGNGGIHSTTGDMYKWYLALKTNKILPKSLFEQLTTPYILEQEGGNSYYGYGWAIYNSDRSTKIISHNGGNEIFFHDYIWLPEEDVLIILFTNTSSREVEVAWPIEKMIFDAGYPIEAIKKNLFFLVFDFIKENDIEQVDKLKATIKEKYTAIIKNSSELNRLGYELLRYEEMNKKERAAWAVELFKLNTELFPTNGNIWDSLGEGYLNIGQKNKAISSYKKALELAPKIGCDWCASSTKALEKLENNQ